MSRKYLILISLICKYQKQLAEVVIDKKETNDFSQHIFLSLERKSIFENKMVVFGSRDNLNSIAVVGKKFIIIIKNRENPSFPSHEKSQEGG